MLLKAVVYLRDLAVGITTTPHLIHPLPRRLRRLPQLARRVADQAHVCRMEPVLQCVLIPLGRSRLAAVVIADLATSHRWRAAPQLGALTLRGALLRAPRRQD